MKARSFPDPLPAALGLFIAGIAAAGRLPHRPPLLFALSALLVVPAVFPALHRGRARMFTALSLLLFFLPFGAGLAQYHLTPSPGDASFFIGEHPVLVEAKIPWLVNQAAQNLVVTVRKVTTGGGTLPARGKILLVFPGGAPPLEPGDIVRFRAALEKPTRDDGFDFPAHLARQGVFTVARPSNNALALVGAEPPPLPARLTARARRLAERRIDALMPDEPQATMLKALTFGLGRTTAPLREDFQRAGAYHILVVSGLHTGFFILMLHLLLSPLPSDPRLKAALYLPFLAAYALLCGLATPVARAALMAGFYCLGKAFNRGVRAEYALYSAAFLLLLVNPGDLSAPGWQLTFAVTLGIILGLDRLRAYAGRLPRKLFIPLTASVLAQATAIPLVAFHFGQVAVLGLVSNILFIPLAALVVFSAFPGMLPGVFGALFAQANWFFLTVFHRAAVHFAELPFSSYSVTPGNHFWHLGHLPLLLLIYFRRPGARRRARNDVRLRRPAVSRLRGIAARARIMLSFRVPFPGKGGAGAAGTTPGTIPTNHAQRCAGAHQAKNDQGDS